MRRRGGLSGLRPELEGDMPPRVEVRRRARQMQNEAARRADCHQSNLDLSPRDLRPGELRLDDSMLYSMMEQLNALRVVVR